MDREEVAELLRLTIQQIVNENDLDAVDITIIHSAKSTKDQEDWSVTTHMRTKSE